MRLRRIIVSLIKLHVSLGWRHSCADLSERFYVVMEMMSLDDGCVFGVPKFVFLDSKILSQNKT